MVKEYFKLLRVTHWVKNLFIFIPIIFAKQLFNWEEFSVVLLTFLTFSLITSAVYIFNDLIDIESDRAHPKKKFRPLASETIPRKSAVRIIILLLLSGAILTMLLNGYFVSILAGYIIINIFYSIYLKHVVILDLICIAAGFILRVLAGAVVIDVFVSQWLILTTLFISLFLAVMKRRSEIVIADEDSNSRKVLEEYTIPFIDQISAISAGAVIISYALYSISGKTIEYFNTENLIYTTIFVIFGIFRYMFLVYKKSKGESAIEIMITDLPMLLNVILYFVTVILIIYFG